MKALILNSGVGTRLKPTTNLLPKCLIEINDQTILERQLNALKQINIHDYIITTGPFEEKLIGFVNEKFKDLNVTYVKNTYYDTTNYIYSIWLARNKIDDDILLLHGDLVFDPSLLERLINTKSNNYILVNNTIPLPKKDFKALVLDNKIKKIGVNFFGENVYFCAPLYKIKKETMKIWIKKMNEFIKNGKVASYAEDALNEITDQIDLLPLYYTKEFCMEIDSHEDLKIAKEYFHKDKNVSKNKRKQ